MSLDRLISLYAVQPLSRILPFRKNSQLAILMYHSISEQDEGNVHPYFRLCTPPELFKDQLALLERGEYSVLPLRRAMEQHAAGTLTGKNVVITFDDGFKDFQTHAFPLLRHHGFPATVFLPVDYISQPGPHLGGREHLSWNDVLELSAQGVTFGSHTLSHPQLSSLLPDRVEDELRRSRETLENRLGQAVEAFSYPYAFPENRKPFVAALRACLLRCGYRFGVTTRIGTVSQSSDLLFLPRIPVNAGDDSDFFKAKLEGHYNWIYSVQLFSKRFREAVLS